MVIEHLRDLPIPVILAVIATLLAAESALLVGIVLPAATTVLGLGMLVHFGSTPLWLAIFATAVPSAVGSQLGYQLGRRRANQPDSWLWRYVTHRIGELRVNSMLSYLNDNAILALSIGQLLGGARTFVPRLAARTGISRMCHTACTTASAAVWATTLVFLGKTAGQGYRYVETTVGVAGLPAIVIAAVIWLVMWRLRQLHVKHEKGH